MDPGLFSPTHHKLAPKWAWPGVPAEFGNFGTRSIAVGPLLKFGVHVDPGLFLPADQKLAPKWAWRGERAQFRNFGTPSICLYRMKLRTLFKFCAQLNAP